MHCSTRQKGTGGLNAKTTFHNKFNFVGSYGADLRYIINILVLFKSNLKITKQHYFLKALQQRDVKNDCFVAILDTVPIVITIAVTSPL